MNKIKELNKIIGSVFILSGSTMGASMLALPLVSAGSGIFYSAILLLANWLIMTITGLLILEATLAFKTGSNVGTITRKLLGKNYEVFIWIAYIFLIYATAAAYISGGGSLLEVLFQEFFAIKISFLVSAAIFCLVFGGIIFLGTNSVDYSMRILLTIKIVVLVFMVFILMPYVDTKNLATQTHHVKYIWAAVPIFLNAFGFHFIIPTINTYCKQPPKIMQGIIIASTTIPLIVYMMWLFVSLGVIPILGEHSFTNINSSVSGLVQALGGLTGSKISIFINVFFNVAITTSFLGVALGLFDFLADGLSFDDSYKNRLQTILLTLLPPFLFVIFFKDAFMTALKYSAFFAVILEIFLPVMLVYKLRANKFGLNSKYSLPINIKFLFFFSVLVCW